MLGDVRILARQRYYSDEFQRGGITLRPPATFEYLQDRAEGTCFVRVNGQVIDADVCPAHDDSVFRVTGTPQTQLWIRVAEPGRPAGWLRVDDGAVRLVGRTF